MAMYRKGQRVPDTELPPEVKEAMERRRRERETPEYRQALDEDLAAIRAEVPPARIDPVLGELLESLRAERERLGIGLTEASERSGIERSMLSKLETGKIPNPTFGTLRAYVSALGLNLRLLAEPGSTQAVSSGGTPLPAGPGS